MLSYNCEDYDRIGRENKFTTFNQGGIMKKIISVLIISIVFVIGMSNVGYAANDSTPLDGRVDQSITVVTPPNNNVEGLISPLATFVGGGGVSSLNWGASVHIINWKIKPDTLLPYAFAGHLYIYRNSFLYDSYQLTGGGAMGIGVSGTIDLWKLPKGTYRFKLTGVAMNFKTEVFKVSSNAEITIQVY